MYNNRYFFDENFDDNILTFNCMMPIFCIWRDICKSLQDV